MTHHLPGQVTTAVPALRPQREAPPTPVPYHRLAHLHRRTSQRWRPLLTLLLTAALWCGFLIAAGLLGLLLWWLVPGLPQPTPGLDDPRNPSDMLIAFGMIALLLPSVVLGSRWGGGAPRIVHSVLGCVRWRLLLRAGVVVLPLYAIVWWTSFLLDPPADASMPRLDVSLVALLVIVVVVVPLQSAAEEYAFRGLPQLALGTWLRSPVWGIVLPVPLFIVGHGYDVVGQVSVGMFALCAGFLVWKTGGLELAVVMHVANNLPLAVIAPLSPSSMHQGAVDPVYLLIDLPLTIGVTVSLTLWVSRIHGLRVLEPLRGPGASAW
ncbi:CPBP family intramembrane glutamic endopeptidase [Ruania rhizosphaerae]|uniref:CPBP family intramembrane glutamic endopeptidase n=1 Tax=Ruania rhizosphaerae TaxID=1840413 RepID=UPI001358BFAF|nr:type II CAAX endopeptidase family protein [Ruania rhizosphaerae]